MSYKDFRKARVKRAAGEKASAASNERGREPENTAPALKIKVEQMSEVPELPKATEIPQRAPVTRMENRIVWK